MAEQRTNLERIIHIISGIPGIVQLWARYAARRTRRSLDASGPIPFAPFTGRLDQSRVALLTTGGVHRRSQPPFDMENPDGDASYREIPTAIDLQDLTITHKYYNHRSADRDLNVLFPLEHFRQLVGQGVLGCLAPRHWGFMGHIEGDQLTRLVERTAPEVAAQLVDDGVDFAFLTPA